MEIWKETQTHQACTYTEGQPCEETAGQSTVNQGERLQRKATWPIP